MLAAGGAFDWAAMFSAISTIMVAVGVPWLEFKRRETAAAIARNTEITEANAERQKTIQAKVDAIQKQTDGMQKHLEAVARREGILEGIEAADMASSIAGRKTAVAVTNVADKVSGLSASGTLEPGALEDIESELKALMKTMSGERDRLNKPSGHKL